MCEVAMMKSVPMNLTDPQEERNPRPPTKP